MNQRKAVFHNRAEQVLEYLREKLASEHWREKLPPERDLAAQLGISRWTLRAALKELQKGGLIGKRSQAGTRIVPPSNRKPGERPVSIGIVISSLANMTHGRIHFMIETVRQYLQARDAELEVHKTVYPRRDGISSHFKHLTREVPHDCWALVAPTRAMQKWCVDNKIPTTVIGAGDESMGLTSASVDMVAVCRHAVGMMLRQGHRQLALILPQQEKGEDQASRIGFESAVRDAPHPDAHFTFETHNHSKASVCRLADRLLQAKPRPTAWLVCRQGHLLTLYTYLLSRGVRIPEDLSLVSRDWDDYFVDLVPEVTAYRSNRAALARHYGRLALRMAAGQCVPGEQTKTVSDFIPGQTLGPAPAV